MGKTCKKRKLVDNRLCSVFYCAESNMVHLNLGAMTLHLAADEFEGLSRSFKEAMRRKYAVDQKRGEFDKTDRQQSRTLQ